MGKEPNGAETFLTTYPAARLRKHFDAVAHRAATRVLRLYPHTLAIGVDGSVGRRQPGPYSDVDIFAIVKNGRKPEPFSFFDSDCYVGVGLFILGKEKFKDPIDFFWSRGGSFSARILFDPKGLLRRRIRTNRGSKASARVIESCLWEAYHNIIEYAGKLRNGWHQHDEYLTRYAARIIAGRSQEAVIALNDLSPISENVVWHQVIGASKNPPHFATDFPIAMALKGTAQTRRVFSSGLRLARESLNLIKTEYAGRAKKRNFRALLAEPLEEHGL